MAHINFSLAPLLKCKYEEKQKHNLLEDYEQNDIKSKYPNIFDTFTVTKVKKINNPELWGMYLLSKEELLKSSTSVSVEEKNLFHATSPARAEQIAKNNIDWRRTVRCRFGIGACFSPSPQYAHQKSGADGALMIFKVLVKQIEHTHVNYSLSVPNNIENDTTLDFGNNVYVKYDDYKFYPEFIVYYNNFRYR